MELYGAKLTSGRKALANKRFSRLRLIRVIASDAVKGTLTLDDGVTTDILKFDAKYLGLYGNNITVKVEVGSDATGKKITISDGNEGSILADEVYDQIEVANITDQTFKGSKLVDVSVLATSAEPADVAATALTLGSDGTIADTDYEAAIAVAEQEYAANVLFLDEYNATRNGYIKTHLAFTQDKMGIVCGAKDDDKAAVATDAANYRDVQGRIIYGFPWVKTTINGIQETVNPASFIASAFSQSSPHVDLAFAGNAQFFAGIEGLHYSLGRADYINLKNAGVCAFENDRFVGIKIKSGVVTQIANSSKVMIFRRRMADWLTESQGIFLVNYQNGVNSSSNRGEVKGAFDEFIRNNSGEGGILPSDDEVKGGNASIVDTESLNTDDAIAAGFFKIIYKQRIYSSMRYIVLQAEIGESVVVTEV